jgi:ABC-2 type transport system ATP-binding protein
MTEMIALKKLSKRFGNLVAVDGISLSVVRGEVLGFLGPNGAGKSTTMKMIAGFIEPSEGAAIVCGRDVVSTPVAVKQLIGYLPEGAPTYGDMTPRGFLNFIAQIRGFDGAERDKRVDEVVEKVILNEVMSQPIETLSKGFKRRVGLAQAILHDPSVLILDEPTDGLDPNQKHHVRQLIQDMAHDKAIVVSTHILEEVEAVCSRAVIIARGKLLADGTPDDLISRDPNHNSVVITVSVDNGKSAAEVANRVEGVSSVEALEGARGGTRLRVKTKHSTLLVPELSEAMKAASIGIQEIHVKRGALDDVFRDITMKEASVRGSSVGETETSHA